MDEPGVALVTGAGRGIGQAVAARLAAAGYHVIVSDRTGSMAEDTARLIGSDMATPCQLDVTDRESVHRLVQQVHRSHGRLDLVVNNAMWMRYSPLADITERDADRMWDVGVKGPLWVSQAAVEPMSQGGGGAIVNIASLAAALGTPNGAVYSAVKGAVVSLTRQLAGDLGPLGIRVNAIAPGTIHTEGQSAAMSEEATAYRVQRSPLGRLGATSDVAEAALFLGSPASGFVTGHVLTVDGGISAVM